MIRPVPLTIVLGLTVLACVMPCGLLLADTPATTAPALSPIPDSIREGAVPSTEQIDPYVTPAVEQLANAADPLGQTQAREYLIKQVGVNGSAGFYAAYGKVLSTQLGALLSNANTTQRAKINIGLIAAKATEGTKDGSLSPLIVQLLQDKSDAAALMGMKAAWVALPFVVKQNPNLQPSDPLLTAIVAAVGAHPQPPVGGPIAEEAYHAMLETLTKPKPAPGVANAIVPTTLQLQKNRTILYSTTLPESPEADSFGSLLLTDTSLWTTLGAKQQIEIMQKTSDLIGIAGQRAAVKNTAELVSLLNNEGQVLQSLSNPPRGPLNNLNLASAGTVLMQVRISTPGALIQRAAKEACDAIKADPHFATITPPPLLGAPTSGESAAGN